MANSVQFYKSSVAGKALAYSQANAGVICFDLAAGAIYLNGVVVGEANEDAVRGVVGVSIETEGEKAGQLKIDYSEGASSYVELPLPDMSSIEDRLDAVEEKASDNESAISGVEDRMDAVEEVLNGTEDEPGLVSKVEDLDKILNGDGEEDGLVDRVDAIEDVIDEKVADLDTDDYIDEEITVTQTTGAVAKNKKYEAGTSVKQILMEILQKESQPSATQPSVSLTFAQAGEYEVGTEVTPSYSATLNAGSYTYGPATGIVAKTWEISDNAGNSKDSASGSFDAITVGDDTDYKVTAKASYDASSVVAVTNLGNQSSPEIKIAAGSKSKTSSAITGFRAFFYGTKVVKVASEDIDSDVVRGLINGGKYSEEFKVAITEGSTQVIVAAPASYSNISVKDEGLSMSEVGDTFVMQTVSVEGANGYDAVDYNVWVYSPKTVLGANNYFVTLS